MDLHTAFHAYGAKGFIPFSLTLDYDPVAQRKVLVPPKSWQKFKFNVKHFNASANALALRTGQAGGLFTIDIDNPKDWDDLLRFHGKDEPVTCKAISGSGGIHLHFHWTQDVAGVKSNSKCFRIRDRVLDVDIRNDHGMILMPPSSYSRADGNDGKARYQWVPGRSFEDIDPLQVPDWLVDLLKSNPSQQPKKNTLKKVSEQPENVDKQEFDLPKDLQQFIFEVTRIVGAKLNKLIYFADSETFNIQTTERTCIFAQREHSSNHQYLVIHKTGKMVQRCHAKGEICSGKESEAWVLPEDTLKNLHKLINLSEPVSKELIDLAKKEAKNMVNDFFDGNENMQMTVRDDKTIGGTLQSFNSLCKCPKCRMGELAAVTGQNGLHVQCTKCPFKFPKDGTYLPIAAKFPNLQQYVSQVFNINVNIYNSGSEEVTIGWNEFLEDNLTILAMDSKLNEVLVKALSGTHHRLAELMFALLGEKVVHSADLKKPWFVFEEHVWKNYDDISIRKLTMEPQFSKLLVQAKHAYQRSNVPNKEKKVSQIQKVITSLENNAMQNSIIEQFAVLCHKPAEDFLEKLDKSRNLLAFTNGVFNLDTGIFRPGKPEDMITMTVGYDYDEHKMNDEEVIQEFNRFFFQVFPDQDVAKYVIKFLGSCLAGYTRDQIFVMGHGNGSNGKGVLINLMAKVLGHFAAKIDASFLCGGMPDPDKPTPTLTRLLAKRFVYISEVVDSAKLNEQLFKALCGEEKMPYRPLYGEQREFLPDFKMFMVCNSLPSFNGTDYAMKRRLRVIPFESSFKDANENPDLSKKEFLKDPTLNDRLDTWKWAVMGLLLQAYQLYREEGLTNIPDKMKVYTQSYVAENNIYELAKDMLLEKNEQCGVPQKDFYDQFRLLWEDIHGSTKTIPGKSDIFDKMDAVLVGEKLGKTKRRYGNPQIYGWKGWSLKPYHE